MISFIEFCNNRNNWFLRESTLSIKHFIQDYLSNPGDFTPIAALGDWLDENGETELSELIKEVFNELNQHPPRHDSTTNSPVRNLLKKIYRKTYTNLDVNNGHLIIFNGGRGRWEKVDFDSLDQEQIKQVVLLILGDWVKSLRSYDSIDQNKIPETFVDKKSFEFWNRWTEQIGSSMFMLNAYGNNAEYMRNYIRDINDYLLHFKAEAEPMLPALKKFPKSKEMVNTLRNNIQRCIDYTRELADRGIDVSSLEKTLQDIDSWLQRNFS
jgi:hypothetical protein